MSHPKFSIITVCKNSEKTIERTIVSVLEQSFSDYEYIIIDGKSTDRTESIITTYEKAFSGKLQWRSESDAGIYDAMNKGIALSSGEVIGIINSDDWYEKNTLEIVNAEYSKRKDQIFYGSLRIMRNDVEKQILTVNHSQLPHTMIPHPTCFVPSAIYAVHGNFNIAYKYAGDLELMVRFLVKKVQFKFIDSILANYEEGGTTERYFHRSTKEYFRILRQYGYISTFRMYLHLLNESRREILK